MKNSNAKQWTVDYWVQTIQDSATHCKRSIQNVVVKINGGHPLSSSEHNLIAAATKLNLINQVEEVSK